MKAKKNFIDIDVDINPDYYTLKELIDRVKGMGVRVNDFDKLKFRLSHEDCWYESDTPSFRLTGKNIKVRNI